MHGLEFIFGCQEANANPSAPQCVLQISNLTPTPVTVFINTPLLTGLSYFQQTLQIIRYDAVFQALPQHLVVQGAVISNAGIYCAKKIFGINIIT